MSRLAPRARNAALRTLPGWRYEAGRKAIAKDFRFADFPAAFRFMTGVAFAAEKAGHHPDWSNSWNRVTIALSTHDEGGVTDRDIALATAIEALLAA